MAGRCTEGVIARQNQRRAVLLAARSVNGNGTRTTCQQSKVTVGFLVFPGRPFGQRAFDRLEVFHVQWLHPAHASDAAISG